MLKWAWTVQGDKITMRQGELVANGYREGNTYYLKGMESGKEVRFKLYTFGNKYIQLREMLENGNISQVDFSVLSRVTNK